MSSMRLEQSMSSIILVNFVFLVHITNRKCNQFEKKIFKSCLYFPKVFFYKGLQALELCWNLLASNQAGAAINIENDDSLCIGNGWTRLDPLWNTDKQNYCCIFFWCSKISRLGLIFYWDSLRLSLMLAASFLFAQSVITLR